MRFSIIIPVYNVENYFEKCLTSIVNQSFTDYEVVVVDDETPDNSMSIADKYANRFPDRFHIIHQKNTGQGGARNNGAAVAKGEYLLFVDSDDYIHERMLEILDKKIQETPCEMLIFNYYCVTSSGNVISESRIIQDDVVVTGNGKKAQLQTPPAPWNKVFLRSFFLQSGVRFPEKLLYEDVVTRILVAKAKQIRLCNNSLYYYVQRPGSTMNSKVSSRMMEIKKIVGLVLKKSKEDDLLDEYKDDIDAAMICSLVCVIEGIQSKQANHPYKKDLLQYLLEMFPTYESNPALHPDMKNKVKCLIKGSKIEYMLRFTVIPHSVQTLLEIPIVKKLNDLRKHCK